MDDFKAKKELLRRMKQTAFSELDRGSHKKAEVNEIWHQINLISQISEEVSLLMLIQNSSGRSSEHPSLAAIPDESALRSLMLGSQSTARALQ